MRARSLGNNFFAFGNFGAGRREGRHAAVGRARRSLNAGVGVLLVVVADDQAIVIAIERAGNRGEADVGGAAIARFADDVREFALPLALADHRFISGGDAGGEAACAANLGVRPRHVVRRAQVRTVRDIHAARRTDQDGIVARCLARHSVLNGGPAAGAGAMPRNERFGGRQFRVVKTRTLIRAIENRQVAAAELLWLPYQFSNRRASTLYYYISVGSGSARLKPCPSQTAIYSSNPTQCVRFSIFPRRWASSIFSVIQ